MISFLAISPAASIREAGVPANVSSVPWDFCPSSFYLSRYKLHISLADLQQSHVPKSLRFRLSYEGSLVSPGAGLTS